MYFQIEDWAAWAPGISTREEWLDFHAGRRLIDTDQAADVKFLPAMQRRRLSPLARAAFHVTEQVMENATPCPSIFCSTYGETQRTFGILENIANKEDVSPTAFSLSVHNAISGQYTIFFNNTHPTSAMAPGFRDYLMPLADALGQIAEHQSPVLVVYYEEALPEFYRPYARSTDFPCAIALRIGAGSATDGYRLEFNPDAGRAADEPDKLNELPILQLIHFLAAQDTHLASGNWTISKANA